MSDRISDEDVAAYLAALECEGPETPRCLLQESHDASLHLGAGYDAGGFQFLVRTGNPRGRPKLPVTPKPARGPRLTPEERKRRRYEQENRRRRGAAQRARFYAWRNEWRRKRRAAGVPYRDVGRTREVA